MKRFKEEEIENLELEYIHLKQMYEDFKRDEEGVKNVLLAFATTWFARQDKEDIGIKTGEMTVRILEEALDGINTFAGVISLGFSYKMKKAKADWEEALRWMRVNEKLKKDIENIANGGDDE